MKYAILMADIKSSSKKESRKLIFQFKQVVEEHNSIFKSVILSPITITLGDEFQGIIKTKADAIKIIFKIEEFIIEKEFKFKFRYSLNYGEIETKINNKVAYEMLGSGLTDARASLVNIKKSDTRFFVLLRSGVEDYVNKAFIIYQSIVDSWKPKDLKIVSEFLKIGDYKLVAKKIKIDVSSAWRRKKSLHINEYLAIKEIIIKLINE